MIEMDNKILAIWAKTPSEKNSKYHPLLCHLIDVYAVTLEMWKECLQMDMKTSISNNFDLDDINSGKWIAFFCCLHDIGKASPTFQRGKHDTEKDHVSKSTGLRFPITHQRKPHGWVTANAVRELLNNDICNNQLCKELVAVVSTTIAGHHGIFPQTAKWDSLTSTELGDENWENIRKEIFKKICRLAQIQDLNLPHYNPDNALLMILAGLTSVADWIGSNTVFFPAVGENVKVDEYFDNSFKNAKKALEILGWTGWKPLQKQASFEQLFPDKPPRPLQVEAINICSKIKEPGMVLIEAPMGEGKTEAAMYIADFCMASFKQQGCYFALPTQAASNQMLKRIQEFLATRYERQSVNLQLLHGHAMLSSEFDKLRISGIYDEDNKMETDENKGRVLAHEWFQFKKRGLLSPFAVGTIDQALLSVLQTKHGFVRLFALSHKTVIIDEVHAYDTYMTELLERLLEWLHALDVNVIMLSATLPLKKRDKLLKSFSNCVTLNNAEYPRITWVCGNESDSKHFEPVRKNFIINIEWLEWDTKENFVQCLLKKFPENGHIAIICNTVTRAQQLYLELKKYLVSEKELLIFHARFPFENRDNLETEILKTFGSHEDKNLRNRKILVATQVIEQSLDLNFDFMITELAPIDLILQRAGRLHRHNRERPKGFDVPRLLIVKPELDEKGIPVFGPNKKVYEEFILLQTWATIKNRNCFRLPNDMEDLIENVYSDEASEKITEIDLRLKIENLRNNWEGNSCSFRQIAQSNMICPPDYEDNILEEFNKALEEDNPELHQSLRATTRLAEPSITIACLTKGSDKIKLDGSDVKLSEQEIKQILKRTVSINHKGIINELLKIEVPKIWGKTPLLRFVRPIEFESGQYNLGNYTLSYDNELGIVITKIEENTEEE